MCAESPSCMSSDTQVLVRLAVGPRPPGRLRHAGPGGRDRSDPPFSMPGVASATVGMCTAIPPSAGVAPGPAIPCGKAKGEPERARRTENDSGGAAMSEPLRLMVDWAVYLADGLSMGIENGTLSGIENGTLRDGPCGGSVATGAGAVPESRRLTIPPPSGLSRRPPPWTLSGGWPSTAPCASASGSCCPGC